MEDIGCPRCKTTKYRKASLKLLVNSCGHALCDTCVELLFAKGAGNCPECDIPLRRSGFRVQLFENPRVEKYVDIKRRLLKDFCKVEADFQSLREYNDYLEMVETYVFNLAHNIDFLETNRAIDAYKQENRDSILRSRYRLNPELLELDAILDEEQLLAKNRQLEDESLIAEERKLKTQTKESLIDELMFSDSDAAAILQTHNNLKQKQEEALAREREEFNKKKVRIVEAASERIENIKKNQGGNSGPTFSTGISVGGTGAGPGGSKSFLTRSEDPLYFYEEFHYENPIGPDIPTHHELREAGTLGKSVKIPEPSQIAGGYHPCFQLGRELLEAYSDLYFVPKRDAGIKKIGGSGVEELDQSIEIMDTN